MEHSAFIPGVNGILSDRTLLLVAKETRKSKELISVVYCRRVCVAVEKSRTLQGSTFRSWLAQFKKTHPTGISLITPLSNTLEIALKLSCRSIFMVSWCSQKFLRFLLSPFFNKMTLKCLSRSLLFPSRQALFWGLLLFVDLKILTISSSPH